jgi:hypothetical protein
MNKLTQIRKELEKEMKRLNKKNAGISFLATRILKGKRRPVKISFKYKDKFISNKRIEIQAKLQLLTEIEKLWDEREKEIIEKINNWINTHWTYFAGIGEEEYIKDRLQELKSQIQEKK